MAISKHRTARLLAAGLAALALQLAAPAARAEEPCKLRTIEMPIQMVGGRPMAKVKLNGAEVPLLVDTGASVSMLTESTASQLGLKTRALPGNVRLEGATGTIEARLTTVKSLQLLKAEFSDVDFIVGGNEIRGAMGIMGRNFLNALDTEYDLSQGVIRFVRPTGDCEDRQLAYWAPAEVVSSAPLLSVNEKPPSMRVTGKVDGREVEILLDTGADSGLTLRMAQRLGMDTGQMALIGKHYGAGSGAGRLWVTPIRSFEVGGEKIGNTHLQVLETRNSDFDMLLGADFFLSHRVYVSQKQRRIYFTYSGGPVFVAQALWRAAKGEAAPPAEPVASAAASTWDQAEPKDAAGYARRATVALSRRDHARALADLDRACELEPASPQWLAERAHVHEAMRQPLPARRDFDAALRLDPSLSSARLSRATLLVALREREAALADLDALHRTLPPASNLRNAMAGLYQALQLPQQALAQWQLWVPTHRNEARLHETLGRRCRLLAMEGTAADLDQALDDCDDAIDVQRKDPGYRDSRGWVRLRRGDLWRAHSDFDTALELKPGSAWSLYGRGLTRIKRGDAEAGRADIEAARKAMPGLDAILRRYGLDAATFAGLAAN